MALANCNVLEALINRATNPNEKNVDELAVQQFCVTVRNDPELINKATALIISKIRSPNILQSVRALSLLEECMVKCGSEFQDEVGKFRFLNDLIKLVSKNHDGERTPLEIRSKIMDCLLLWTTEYPSKTKIREAYDQLRKEDRSRTDFVITPNKKESVMGIDEEKLRKLLKSTNADDLRRANLLIQAKVKQDARKMALLGRYKTQLQEISNTATLLNQMLDVYETNKKDMKDDSIHLINELWESCESYVPIVGGLPDLIDNANVDLIEQTFEVSDHLQTVIGRYKAAGIVLASSKQFESREIQSSTDLLDGLVPSSSKCSEVDPPPTLDPLDELFGKCENTTTEIQTKSLFEDIDLLEPIVTIQQEEAIKHPVQRTTPTANSPTNISSVLKDIDLLSERLFQENLKTTERMTSFKKEPGRVSLNALANEKSLNKSPTELIVSLNLNHSNKDDPLEENECKETLNTHQIDEKDSVTITELQSEKTDTTFEKDSSVPSLSLSEIEVDLDDISNITEERLLLDDDLKLTFNLTSNRPSQNVSVIVVSATNKTKLPITGFQFEAIVRKPNKVRLLPATGDSMPGIRPFKPPTLINQVMLLSNPTKAPVDVTCIVAYKLGDDPDPIKESIIAKSIPYAE